MVCAEKCLITNIEAKWPGSVHDARIFRESDLSRLFTQGRSTFFISALTLNSLKQVFNDHFMFSRTIQWDFVGQQGLSLSTPPFNTLHRPHSAGTEEVQLCPLQDEGANRDDLWPPEVTLSVSKGPQSSTRQGM